MLIHLVSVPLFSLLPVAFALVAGNAMMANLAVYEPFDYPAGSDVVSQEGGLGFTGAWSPKRNVTGSGSEQVLPGSAVIRAGSLSYSDGMRNLVTSGGSLFMTGERFNTRVARAIDLSDLPDYGEDPRTEAVTYISFLAQRGGQPADPGDPVYLGSYPYGGNLYPRSAGIGLFGWNDGELLQLFFGNLSNRDTDVWRFTGEDLYGDERRDARSNVPFGDGQAIRLVVIRIDHGGGGWFGDRIRVWIDPDLSREEANRPPVTFDWTTRAEPLFLQPAILSMEANDGSALRPHAELGFDEFRIGDTWASVTPHTGGTYWADRPLHHNGLVHSGEGFLGWLAPSESGWTYAWTLDSWIHIPEQLVTPEGSWAFLRRTGRETPAIEERPSLVLAYEGFDYIPDSASGQPDLIKDGLDGGSGWAGSWTNVVSSSIDGWAFVREESLAYTDLDGHVLETSGGHAWISGIPGQTPGGGAGTSTRIRRTLANPPSAEPGNRLYMSFVGIRAGEPADPGAPVWSDLGDYPDGYPFGDNLYPRNAGLKLHSSKNGADSSAQIGNLSDQQLNRWSLSAESTHVVSELEFTEQAFMVVRIDYTAHRTTNLRGEIIDQVGTVATVWVNPASLLDEDPNDARREVIYKDLVDPFTVAVAGIGLEAGDDSANRPVAEFEVDEIRIGTDWDAVTPVEGGKPPREPPELQQWAGLPVIDGSVWGGRELQWLWSQHAPWLYCHKLKTWIYCPESTLAEASVWIYILDLSASGN